VPATTISQLRNGGDVDGATEQRHDPSQDQSDSGVAEHLRTLVGEMWHEPPVPRALFGALDCVGQHEPTAHEDAVDAGDQAYGEQRQEQIHGWKSLSSVVAPIVPVLRREWEADSGAQTCPDDGHRSGKRRGTGRRRGIRCGGPR